MKRFSGLVVLAVMGGLMLSGSVIRADELVIQSFSTSGQLAFGGVSNEAQYATSYRIEWASSPGGGWTNFAAAAASLDVIPSPVNGTGTVSVLVPMCYRVVATMVVLPLGTIQIPAGTNSGTDPDSGAYMLNNATPFYMDKYPVTKAKWDAVYQWAIINGYTFGNAGSGKAEDHPVQMVNWYDCVKWCNARSEKEGRPVSYRVAGNVYRNGQDNAVTCDLNVGGYRLPTDAEFHYAARGGLSGKRFPWGDTIDHDQANYTGYPAGYSYDLGYLGYDTRYAVGDSPYTCPVGSFESGKTGYGLYDMTGNVSEWCWDWYPGLEGYVRVFRGGSFMSYADESRVGFRSNTGPDYAGTSIGFRVVLSPVQ